MGNLRDKYTNEEWDQKESKIESDRKEGKPDDGSLNLSIWDKDINELISLRELLIGIYDKYDLLILDKWIVWKS